MTFSTLHTQAQTKSLSQSHLQQFNQSALIHSQKNTLSSPTMSSTSSSSSPTPSAQHCFQSSPPQHFYSMDHHHHHHQQQQQQQQQNHHHHMQILGNHPASPGSGMFLDLPTGNFLFTDNNPMITPATEPHFLHYNNASSPQEDCHSSSDYIYGNQPVVKTEFSNEQFAAIAPTYMMSMARSFSDSQLSQICGSDVTGIATTSVKTEMCDSPLMYAQQGLYEDDNSYNMNNSSLYSNQQPQHNHHHHHHSYSTSSLSTFSDSSMSPRSNFSTSNSSLTSYPLSRTLSEPLFHQGVISSSSSMSDLARLGNDSDPSIISNKPTPKRSRGRRVSNHPDTSGCKVFTCRVEDCGKIFKRSEHLKRHVRSIHTLEKPFPCPIQNCPKRFSRSDNLNQHIRIHRHSSSSSGRCSTSEKSKDFASFTPYLQTYSDIISL